MASIAYIAASGNRFSHCADSSDSLIAFGTSILVGLWPIDWRLVFKIQAHAKALSALAVYKDTVVTSASDSLVKVWKLSQTDNGNGLFLLVDIVKYGLTAAGPVLQEQQTLSYGKRYALALALACLPSEVPIDVLAVGGTDNSVHLWVRSDDSAFRQFVRSATLTGHEDWIRCLDFQQFSPDQPLVLASGSQDGNVRLWNIEPFENVVKPAISELNDDLLDAFEASLNELGEGEEGGKQISLKKHVLTAKASQRTLQFSVTFDALLIGHEAGLTSLHWRPKTSDESTPTLLSTSTDSSLILWMPSSVGNSATQEGSSIWINYQRFGDVGGQRLGGFIGGIWADGGSEALAWGWSGGWRRWRCNRATNRQDESWHELGAITGHSGPVKGIDWSLSGNYLISTGLDQTTRIHGRIPGSSTSETGHWHELGRPQVHGYDLLDAVFITDLKFASIADEKVVRVFEAPRSFVETLETLRVSKFSEAEVIRVRPSKAESSTDLSPQQARPAGASVPPLGLSNKAVGEGTSQALAVAELDRSRRPFEGELAASTLWPEIEKIFGHGYESISLAVSNSRGFIATACKATSAEHATVRIYDTQNYRLFGEPLAGHVLTVTRIAFSPDDKLILTVSRDRTWRLFELKDGAGFVPVAADKSHARIIWDCAWAPGGKIFATASRDKTVKIWKRKSANANTSWECIETIKTMEAATAVAFSPSTERHRLAIGQENGTIITITTNPGADDGWKTEFTVDSKLAHVGQIHQLSWRPTKDGANSTQLASCSEDVESDETNSSMNREGKVQNYSKRCGTTTPYRGYTAQI
ncbi:elongator complex protein 2 [Coprinopsis cinerea okayama7|uniref:Elongator complex protein 2 n=1 Tax=Coprinopsis cinerea (strain Okayama-7 / 130 / ATCC MYA-4618 / FGSC 9003) TaxID=240176 RepID=A8NXA7_COPC7|nr:elongator complex protein 2 [Coprinopsis cinerea okayama7\|eukprot:XP_001837114.2 elongator complex protein 2 [Coprinopsis cinerea okayama7\